jgi:D-glycero-alpha-D-manno-heptose-7-phosphate kinase
MIISRTPFRVSLFGGGTDYPAWYRENGGGAVIGATINKYCYISIRSLPPFFQHRHRIVYSNIELVNSVDEIQHPAVRAVLKEHGIQEGVEIQYHGDLPARSGMGSSSAFTVGLLHAVRSFQGCTSRPNWLAQEAIRIEQEVLREHVGSQDQIWAAYGGMSLITFLPDGSFKVAPLLITPERREELESHLLLFFTGFSRFAPAIAEQQIRNLRARTGQLESLLQMVREAACILQDPQRAIRELGAMLDEAWKKKKELADCISTGAIDQIYDAATQAGALGGKLLGAGGGGFLLLFAEPSRHEGIRQALHGLIEVSFRIGSPGSTIVIYEPDGLEISSPARARRSAAAGK